MSSRVHYYVGGNLMRAHDAAVLLDGEDPRAELVQSVIGTISTDIEVTVGGTTMHLAAWMDPEHWEDDWTAAGVEDVDALVASAVAAE